LVFFVAINCLWFGSAVSITATLTVATYNVENYLVADRMVDGVYRTAYPKPEKERQALVRVIAGVAPDILAVQEMGTAPFLAEFQAELKQAGQDFPYTTLLAASDPDRHVAVLSKVPFKAVNPHASIKVKYQGRSDVVKRGLLEVVVATDQGDLAILVAHLKSKRTDHPEDPEASAQRHAEAEAVRDLVLARFPDPTRAKYVLCGDWNDTPYSKPIRTLLRRGSKELGELLVAPDSRGETWTQHYRREDLYSRFDYLLVSPALKPFVATGRARIWDGSGTGEGSDHRPVVMELKLTAAPR